MNQDKLREALLCENFEQACEICDAAFEPTERGNKLYYAARARIALQHNVTVDAVKAFRQAFALGDRSIWTCVAVACCLRAIGSDDLAQKLDQNRPIPKEFSAFNESLPPLRAALAQMFTFKEQRAETATTPRPLATAAPMPMPSFAPRPVPSMISAPLPHLPNASIAPQSVAAPPKLEPIATPKTVAPAADWLEASVPFQPRQNNQQESWVEHHIADRCAPREIPVNELLTNDFIEIEEEEPLNLLEASAYFAAGYAPCLSLAMLLPGPMLAAPGQAPKPLCKMVAYGLARLPRGLALLLQDLSKSNVSPVMLPFAGFSSAEVLNEGALLIIKFVDQRQLQFDLRALQAENPRAHAALIDETQKCIAATRV